MSGPGSARATYRLQLRREFDFTAAAGVVGYLADLGVTHAYLSPCTLAAEGSEHGYDVADPNRISDDLGGRAAFDALVEAAHQGGLRILLDVVPNHMAADPRRNHWWRDVLEDGRGSPGAAAFDIDWTPGDAELDGRVLVPILAAPLAETASDLRLERRGGHVLVRYHDHELPVALPSLATALEDASADGPLAEAAAAAAALPAVEGDDQAARRRRAVARRALHERLEALPPASVGRLDGALAVIAADSGRLRRLLDAQHWLLAHWREAGMRLNHRRFFTISSLVGVRVEDEAVFERTHGLVAELTRSGAVDGLRIDHIDGLRDPARYLERLAALTEGRWTVVEKILEEGEALPEGWRCAGTTGYELGSLLVGLSVDPAGAASLRALRDRLGPRLPDFSATVAEAKRLIVECDLATDVGRLCRALEGARRTLAGGALRAAVEAMLVAMPVYRTYVDPQSGSASAADGAALAAALRQAEGSGADRAVLAALAEVLGGRGWDEGHAAAAREGTARFQQLSPPVMAKGLEDTALYRDTAVPALDEVGCSPDRPLVGPDAWHAHAVRQAERAPLGLLATSTHDTKRSEDVRARLCALTERVEEVTALVERWHARAVGLRGGVDGATELLVHQTVLGAWPIEPDRLVAYLVKAAREAAVHTRWTAVDETYERDLERLCRGLLADARYRDEVGVVLAEIVPLGRIVSLAWTLLRLTAPGVPDTYQGTELWDLSLVDPDNRRPVDYAQRRQLLRRARDADAGSLVAEWDSGLPKLAIVSRALALRARRPSAFGDRGAYRPLLASGAMADHVVAFARGEGPDAVTVVPRLPGRVAREGWGDTAVTLPPGRWYGLLDGAEVEGGRAPVAELLTRLPVCLLERGG